MSWITTAWRRLRARIRSAPASDSSKARSREPSLARPFERLQQAMDEGRFSGEQAPHPRRRIPHLRAETGVSRDEQARIGAMGSRPDAAGPPLAGRRAAAAHGFPVPSDGDLALRTRALADAVKLLELPGWEWLDAEARGFERRLSEAEQPIPAAAATEEELRAFARELADYYAARGDPDWSSRLRGLSHRWSTER